MTPTLAGFRISAPARRRVTADVGILAATATALVAATGLLAGGLEGVQGNQLPGWSVTGLLVVAVAAAVVIGALRVVSVRAHRTAVRAFQAALVADVQARYGVTVTGPVRPEASTQVVSARDGLGVAVQVRVRFPSPAVPVQVVQLAAQPAAAGAATLAG